MTTINECLQIKNKEKHEWCLLRHLGKNYICISPNNISIYNPLNKEMLESMIRIDQSCKKGGARYPGPDFGSEEYGIGIEVTTAQSTRERQQQSMLEDAIGTRGKFIEDYIKENDKKNYFRDKDLVTLSPSFSLIGFHEFAPLELIENKIKKKCSKLKTYKQFSEQWLVIGASFPSSCIDESTIKEHLLGILDSKEGFDKYFLLFIDGKSIIADRKNVTTYIMATD